MRARRATYGYVCMKAEPRSARLLTCHMPAFSHLLTLSTINYFKLLSLLFLLLPPLPLSLSVPLLTFSCERLLLLLFVRWHFALG